MWLTPALLILVVLSGCSKKVEGLTFHRYVALGDSSVAGPAIPIYDQESGNCARSSHNFPAELAVMIAFDEVVDVSCSGATTDDVTKHGQTKAGISDPQLDAVTPDTDLVTIGIGGNDGGFMNTLWWSCVYGDKLKKDCSRFVDDYVPAFVPAIQENVANTLKAIRSKAPDATVVLVGYLRAAPDSGTCDTLQTPASVVNGFRQAERRLADAFEAAASEAGALFVPMYQLSHEHDVCSDDPWMNGGVGSTYDGALMHPRAKGMKEIANAVVDVLKTSTTNEPQ